MIPTYQSANGLTYIRSLGPAAWYRYGVGITVTGAGVSTWADQSGNGNDLLQGTDGNRPALQADGSILFDGAPDRLVSSAFTFNQPFTYYLLFKQVTWTDTDAICDGVVGPALVQQQGSSPRIRLAGSAATTATTKLGLDVYAAMAVVGNGASSLIQVGENTPDTGNMGTGDPGGFVLGGNAGLTVFANIQVKEVILYAAAHDATQRANVIRYLMGVGGLG